MPKDFDNGLFGYRMPICEMVRKANLWMRGIVIAYAASLAMIWVRRRAIGHHELEAAVGRVQQPARNGNALGLIGIEQSRIRVPFDDERELPREIVRLLQARVHALRADGAVDVRGVTQKKASPVAEVLSGAMMDAIGGKPAARLERQPARFVLQGRNDGLECDAVSVTRPGRQNAHDPPMVRPTHGKEQVKTVAPQIDIDLIGNHVSRDVRVGHEEHMLIRRPRKANP